MSEKLRLSVNDLKLVDAMYQKDLLGFLCGSITKAQFARLERIELIEGSPLRPRLSFRGRMVARGLVP